VTVPNAPDSALEFDEENAGVLVRSKASARHWTWNRSLNLVLLNIERHVDWALASSGD